MFKETLIGVDYDQIQNSGAQTLLIVALYSVQKAGTIHINFV